MGKTFLVREFGRNYFQNYIELNLEDLKIRKLFESPLSLEDFLETVRIGKNLDPSAPNTLLFLDEIQEVPWILELLRFFYEQRPEIAVIASGSLLEIKLQKKQISTPVGRIKNLFLYPICFHEFLTALDEKPLLDAIKSVTPANPLPTGLHQTALRLFQDYLLVGGMPEALASFIEKGRSPTVSEILSDLLLTYQEDVLKYAEKQEIEALQHVIEQAPRFAGVRYNYAKFAGSKFNTTRMQNAFKVLEQALVLHQLEATDQTQPPIFGQKKRQRKLIFADVGLVSHSLGLNINSPGFQHLNSAYRGQIYEQVVGQELIATNNNHRKNLFYWAKQSSVGAAEVDFFTDFYGLLTAIEVKSGKPGKLKSLKSIAESNPEIMLVRIDNEQPSHDKLGNSNLLSLPIYLVQKLPELVKSL